MTSSRLALAERAVRDHPEDPEVWTRLAIEAARAASEPDALADPALLDSMVRAWLARPACLELADHVLPLIGLRVAPYKQARPGTWWREPGRSRELPDLRLCVRSGLPLDYVRVADGAEMVLVPWWGERPRPLRISSPADAAPASLGAEAPGRTYRPFLVDRSPIRYREMLRCDRLPAGAVIDSGELFSDTVAEGLDPDQAHAYCRAVRAEVPTLAAWLGARTLGSGDPAPPGPIPEALVRAPVKALAAMLPGLPAASGAGLLQPGGIGEEWFCDDWEDWMVATGRLRVRPNGYAFPRQERMRRARLRPVKHFLDELDRLAGLAPPAEIPEAAMAAAAGPEDVRDSWRGAGAQDVELSRWGEPRPPPPRRREFRELGSDDPAHGASRTELGNGVDFEALEDLLREGDDEPGRPTVIYRHRRGTREF